MSEKLRLALEEVMDEMYPETDEEHVFSKRFDRRIKKLARLDKMPKIRLNRKTVRLLIIAVLLAVVAVCGFITTNVIFGIEECRYVPGFTAVKAELGGAPKRIERYYELTPPEGFWRDMELRCTDEEYQVQYTNGEVFYTYAQYTEDSFYISYPSETNLSFEYGRDNCTVDVRYTGYGELLASHFWSDGEYIYAVIGRIEGFDFSKLNDCMTEVFPEPQDADFFAFDY